MKILIAFLSLMLGFAAGAGALPVTLTDNTRIEVSSYTQVDSETVELNTKYGALKVKRADILEPAYLKVYKQEESTARYRVVTSPIADGGSQRVYFEDNVAIATETITLQNIVLQGRIKEAEYLEYYNLKEEAADMGIAEPVTRLYPWVSVELYTVADAYDKFDAAMADPDVRSDIDWRPGLGVRIGLSTHYRKDEELGISLGYIEGPYEDMVQRLGLDEGSVVSRSHFVRVMLEYSKTIYAVGKGRINFSGSAGLASGTVSQSVSINGQHIGTDYISWTGPSADLAIGIPFVFAGEPMEFGVRKSFFPSQDEFPEVEWRPFSVYYKFAF